MSTGCQQRPNTLSCGPLYPASCYPLAGGRCWPRRRPDAPHDARPTTRPAEPPTEKFNTSRLKGVYHESSSRNCRRRSRPGRGLYPNPHRSGSAKRYSFVRGGCNRWLDNVWAQRNDGHPDRRGSAMSERRRTSRGRSDRPLRWTPHAGKCGRLSGRALARRPLGWRASPVSGT